MKLFEDYVQDKYGNRQSSVSLTVNVNGSAATVYSSKTGAAQSNPITTDSDGNFSFWYNKPGTYTFLDSNSNVLLTKTLEVTTNVVEFGCAGNGTTDDTTAFQNAVNEGGIVVVPSGDYLLSPASRFPMVSRLFLTQWATPVGRTIQTSPLRDFYSRGPELRGLSARMNRRS
jgi:hypothetical protein